MRVSKKFMAMMGGTVSVWALSAPMLNGQSLASTMTIEFSGARAQKVYSQNFGDLAPVGPIEIDGNRISMKHKEVLGKVSCHEKTKLDLYDPSIQNKPSFKCTITLTYQPEGAEAAQVPVTQ